MCTNKVPCSDGKGGVVYRPCGRCLDCLSLYQQDWSSRLDYEVKAWDSDKVIFFTLTYAEDMLPFLCTYNNPINLNTYQCLLRSKQLTFLDSRLRRLGLNPFNYYRSKLFVDKSFIEERRCVEDSALDIPRYERRPVFVPTVNYDDVNTWVRYCRKYFDRHVVSEYYRDRRVSPYLKDRSFKNIHGLESAYPASAYTPSFKYFITSEYGPSSLRPHYHGVFFGVDEDMFRTVFAPYWRDKFGLGSSYSVDFSVFDASKGGAMYIAKYCSKGSFEHPLCSKVFNYPSGKVFSSKDYVRADNFGFKEDFEDSTSFPLCTPTFHLISKGIGIRYCFNADLQTSYNIQCDEFTDFVVNDLTKVVVPRSCLAVMPTSETRRLGGFFDFDNEPRIKNEFAPVQSYLLYSDKTCKRLLSRSDFIVSDNDDFSDFVSFANKMFNKKYVRSYVYQGKNKTFTALLPRYYRKILVSPLASFAVSDFVRSRSESLFEGLREQLRPLGKEAHDCAIEDFQFSAKFVEKNRAKEVQRRFNKFYSKLFKVDIINAFEAAR